MPSRGQIFSLCQTAGGGIATVLPLLLLTTRGGAETAAALIAILFLVQSWARRRWDWLGSPLMLAGLCWWGWTLLATFVQHADVGRAAAALRLPVGIVAITAWCDASPRLRPRLELGIAAICLWIGIESWHQFLTGSNLMGMPRNGDGALTGPYRQPRAGPNFVLTLFPALLPLAGRLAEGSAGRRAAGLGLMLLAASTAVLIGQRMPALLVVLGLVLSALLLPRLRGFAITALAAGTALAAATPVVSPATYHKLITRLGEQLGHFWVSSYGQLYAHGLELVGQHKLFGIGYNAFRDSCGGRAVDLAVRTAARDVINPCATHPHNYYLEAAVNGGLPGLLAFIAMAAAMLAPALRYMRAARPADRARAAGLLTGLIVALWPLASTSSFMMFPNLGWIMLMAALAASYAGDAKLLGASAGEAGRAQAAS